MGSNPTYPDPEWVADERTHYTDAGVAARAYAARPALEEEYREVVGVDFPRQPLVDQDAAAAAVRALLAAIGEDPDREGLQDTPARVARAWAEFMDPPEASLGTSFTSEGTDQMVVVSGMRVWSICEHHLMPFWTDVAIAYIAGARLLGLSKLARIAHHHAHRLQLQERLVEAIAQDVQTRTSTADVAVTASGVHLCMVARGVRTEGVMTSSAMYGRFRTQEATRAEFLSLARGERRGGW